MDVRDQLSENLLFSIIYKDQEVVFNLSKYCSIGDLKAEIFYRLGIPLSNQEIGWHRVPQSDEDFLENYFDSDFNCLVVYNVDENQDVPMEVSEGDYILSACHREQSYQDKIMESTSALDFIQHFSANYDDSGIMLHMCSLEDAINEACFTSLESRKILILYFHNKTDKFSKLFAEHLTKPEVKETLNTKFFILGWDVENETYHSALKNALLKHNELTYLVNFVENKTCAALLIVPIKESITLFSCLREKVSKKDFLATLNKAREFLKTENEIEEDLSNFEHSQNDIGSAQYQQLMLDMLGDRDYDSFDFCEFDLLKDKIGYALFGPPKKEEGYDGKERKKIDSLFAVIVKESNKFAKWKDRVIMSFIYNCTEPLPSEKQKRMKKYGDYNPHTDLTPTPIFILRKCKNSDSPCRLLIDDSGRVYSSWGSYLKNNKLGQCEMILPLFGRYEADDNGHVKLEMHLSPACGIGPKILMGTDIASTAVGLASGSIFIAAAAIPAITVAPVALVVAGAAGIGVGIYSIGRSVYTLIDRGQHKETLSFANSESRGAYLGIVAGSLGFVGTGANMAVSQLAARGFNIGQGASTAVNVIGIANIGASGINVANSSFDVFHQWFNENQRPSLLTIVQLSSSILFFGHAVYNFKQCGSIIEEAQANSLRDYQDNLRSNRHRKTFNKLVKETVRQNNHDTVAGQAQVIKTINKIGNTDEVFAALTRSNRAMNENGVRFAAQDGVLTLNGVTVDLAKFTTMDQSEVVTFLTKLPNTPEPTQSDVKTMSSALTSKFTSGLVNNRSELTNLAFGLLKIFGNTEDNIKEKIVNCVALILNQILNISPGVLNQLYVIFPNHDSYFRILNMVNAYFQSFIDAAEEKYQNWLRTRDSSIEEPYYVDLSLDRATRAVQIFNIISKIYFVGVNPTQAALKEILDYFWTWFAKQVAAFEEFQERRQKRVINSGSPRSKIKCPDCGGDYYR